MNPYPITEHFPSLQGEGVNAGKPAYFLRLGGCNVRCAFCDSKKSWDEHSGKSVSALEMVEWVKTSGLENVVITGGEPLLHNLDELCKVLRQQIPNVSLCLETSGTATFSGDFDWVCLSPKEHCLPLTENYLKADELKVVIAHPDAFAFAETQARQVNLNCKLFLQAEWSIQKSITEPIINYILKYPKWRLSVQLHKFLGIL